MRILKISSALCALSLCSLTVQADVWQGKALEEQSCSKCHDHSVYTRPDRRINSLAALTQQVSRCKKPAGAEWDKDETADVVEYLNKEFYRFK